VEITGCQVRVHKSGYASIPGSASLKTAKNGAEPRLRRTAPVPSVVVPLDVFDRTALDLEPEEFAVFLQLFRLSAGEERDGCRVSRAELERRVRMSQLRLGKALAGLIEKGHVQLVDRNKEGTLYHVVLPEERERTTGLPRPASAPKAPPAATSERLTVGGLAQEFLKAGGAGRGRSPDEVVQEILALVEEGHPLDAIRAALRRFLVEMPKKTPIAELSRLIG
jgi:hypothetical protein